MESIYVEPGYYLSIDNDIIKVTVNKAGTRSYAQRMVFAADENGCKILEWVYQPGLGVDLLITALGARDVSRRVREAVAA